MLDACDRHGVLVMDELTDVWNRSKTAFDSSLTFAERWQDDVAALVAKDFNHPSVIMYSIGNEILELATPIGSTWGRSLAEEFRTLDDTRYVTNGINGIIANLDRMAETMAELQASDPNTMMANMGEQMALMNASALVSESTEESASVLDIVGFNYADSRYEQDAEQFPHRVIVGSETFPERIDTMWSLVTRLPHVIGDFTWTGWDYIGEAGIGRVDYTDVEDYVATGTTGPHPYLLAECGDIDITGHRRTVSYYREIVYGLRSAPYHRRAPPPAPRPADLPHAVVVERRSGKLDLGRRVGLADPGRCVQRCRRGRVAAGRRDGGDRPCRRGEGLPRGLLHRVPPGRPRRDRPHRRGGDRPPHSAHSGRRHPPGRVGRAHVARGGFR